MAFIENNTHNGRKLTSEQLNMYRDNDNGIQFVPFYVERDSAEFLMIELESNAKGFEVVHTS